MREQINSDAIAYLRNAQYVVEGRYADSVSGYWSPLLSWCIAPFVHWGMDGLYAARVVLAAWGAGIVLGSFWLTRSFQRRFGWLSVFALCLIAIEAARLATCVISPDVLLAALLLAYCSAVTSRGFACRKYLPLLAGILGGTAYLAKAYALPFFVAHFTLTVGYQFAARRETHAWRRATVSWLIGIVAFVLLAGPWIGVLSWKYGRPTFSTSARVAHTIIGPPDRDRDHPGNRHLSRVPPGRITAGETPELLPYNHWSPFENKAYFIHQVKYSIETAWRILGSIASYDAFRFTLPALVLIPIIMSRPRWRARQRKAMWVLGTVAVYAGGFIFVYWGERYTYPFLFPMCCVYCVTVCTSWLGKIGVRLGLARRARYAARALVAMSFAAAALYGNVQYVRGAMAAQPAYRQMAAEMKTAGCQGPMASLASEQTQCGLYLAYYLGESFAGCLDEDNVDQIDKALDEYGVQTLIVAPNGANSEKFIHHTSWQKKLVVSSNSGTTLYVYTRHDRS